MRTQKIKTVYSIVMSIIIIIMALSVLGTFLTDPAPIIGAENKKGVKFYLSSGQSYLCVCDNIATNYCLPCIDILPVE